MGPYDKALKMRTGTQYYPESIEKYAKDEDGNEVYANHTSGSPFYRKDAKGQQVYAKEKDGNEVYLKLGVIEYVATLDGITPYYARRPSGVPYYPKDVDGHEYRAHHDGVPLDAIHPVTGEVIPLQPNDLTYGEDGRPVYSVAPLHPLTRKPFYLKDRMGNECYPETDREEHYIHEIIEKNGAQLKMDQVARDRYGLPVYARRWDGTVMLPYYPYQNNIKSVIDGHYAYHPTTFDPIYILEGRTEWYQEEDGKGIYARNLVTGEPKYASSFIGHVSEHLATDHGAAYYHTTKEGLEVYPKEITGDEFYKRIADNVEVYAEDPNHNQFYAKNADKEEFLAEINFEQYYAKVDGAEVYPRRKNGAQYYRVKDGVEKLARNADGEEYLAKDENGREIYPLKDVIETDS